MKNGNRNYKKYPMHVLALFFVVSILFISVGFSALSTTLSIDGSSSFIPVGLIRVLSMRQDNIVSVTEINKGITSDGIKNTIDFTSEDGYATYEVVIKNLGQIDYILDHIEEVVFSNDQAEYILDGFQIGNVIHAHEEKTFKVKFKYKDNATGELVSRLNSELKFVFEEYFDDTEFRLVFNHEGACTFNGTDGISGYDCLEYENKTYIDTGISLYSSGNWKKDYEIGFTIEEYNPAIQVEQAVFVNAKNENASLKYPGLVVRRLNNGNDIEVTQTINMGSRASKTITNYTLPADIKIFRIDGIIYYNINGGELVQLQNMNNFNQQFDVTTWIGAAPNDNGGAMRILKGTLSNMYIKMGNYTPKEYTITFNPNGGTIAETTRTVAEYTKIGTLPIPVSTNGTTFSGWYSDSNFTDVVDENTIFNRDTTLYAKWNAEGTVTMDGVYYATVEQAINAAPANIESTITLNENIKGKIIIPENKNIVFDFGEYTLSNSESTFTVENNGMLKVVSGTIKCGSTTSVINNNRTGTLVITGGNILATNTKQAVYNNGGNVTITGTAYLNSTSNIRATVHNLNNGNLTITGGTIVSNNHAGINNESGTMVIGTNDDTITQIPVIQGKTYGITSSANYKFYDGIAKGTTNAVNNQSKIIEIPDNSTITTSTEQIGGKTYKTLYLQTTEE